MSNNIIANSGGKTTKAHRTIKERLINEEAQRRRYVHQDIQEALKKIMNLLKKVTNFKATSGEIDPADTEIVREYFLTNLVDIEESLISLL